MNLNLFDYNLPKKLIAQTPKKPQDHSRLMVLDPPTLKLRRTGKKNKLWQHDYFYNLPNYLNANDVLVFNDSKVFPARLIMQKLTGGKVEVFLLNQLKPFRWEVMIGGKIKEIRQLEIRKSGIKLECEITKKLDSGNWQVEFNYSGKKFREILERIGETPLPPYIKTHDSKKIRQSYQTTYAKNEGSCAAPTAGFHFTDKLLSKLKKKGVKTEFITLHVGLGTFQPVKVNKIEDHKIHSEYATINKSTAARLNKYKQQGKRIIAVGTTSCRTLEAFSNSKGKIKPQSNWTNIFIYPGYKFKFVDSLVTNFHLPKSTLLMLISALASRKFILDAYQEAIKKEYRFYSFGDGMIIFG